MAGKRSIKVAIVNRFFPPNHSITGESAFELANYLESTSDKIEVQAFSIKSTYKGDGASSKQSNKHVYLSSFYHGNKKIFRLIANLYEGYSLINKALRSNADIIICMTDPPLLNFWASILIKNKKPWMLWSMDVYPDAFISAKLVGHKNKIYNYIGNKIRRYRPSHLIALGDVQKNYLTSNYLQSEIKSFILPCGIHDVAKNIEVPFWYNASKISFAYAGNLGEAHSDRFLKNLIEMLDPKKHQIIVSLYGSKSDHILKMINDMEHVVKVDRLSKEDFNYVDVHLVSLLPEWTNVCVPSKAVSAICSEAAILFNGVKSSDTYKMFESASWFIPYSDSEEEERISISRFINKLTRDEIDEKQIQAKQIKNTLSKEKLITFNQIKQEILKIS